jgi:hypothetical protein
MNNLLRSYKIRIRDLRVMSGAFRVGSHHAMPVLADEAHGDN